MLHEQYILHHHTVQILYATNFVKLIDSRSANSVLPASVKEKNQYCSIMWHTSLSPCVYPLIAFQGASGPPGLKGGRGVPGDTVRKFLWYCLIIVHTDLFFLLGICWSAW